MGSGNLGSVPGLVSLGKLLEVSESPFPDLKIKGRIASKCCEGKRKWMQRGLVTNIHSVQGLGMAQILSFMVCYVFDNIFHSLTIHEANNVHAAIYTEPQPSRGEPGCVQKPKRKLGYHWFRFSYRIIFHHSLSKTYQYCPHA